MTVRQALIGKVHWPLPNDFVTATCIERRLGPEDDFTYEKSLTKEWKGALADCYFSLAQAVNYSEAGKSVGMLTDEQRRLMLRYANALYDEIGEDEKEIPEPIVFWGG